MTLLDFYTRRHKKGSPAESLPMKKNPAPAAAEPAAGQGSGAYDPEFMGEHFEGLGDVWRAVFGEAEALLLNLPQIVRAAQLLENCQTSYTDETEVMLLQNPDSGAIRAGVLSEKTPGKDRWDLLSCFPVLHGLPNRLKIRKRHTWENGLEGVVAAEQAEGGAPISFFAPFYFRDFASFNPNSEKVIDLAALALSCEPAEEQEFTLDKGPVYELLRKEFLEENPANTAGDFPAPVISMRGSRMLFPNAYVAEWQYRCPIFAVTPTKFLDRLIYQLRVSFVGTEENDLSGHLYVAEHLLDGYVPRVGDDILGTLWMTGCLADE